MLIITFVIICVFNTNYFKFLDVKSKNLNYEVNGLRFFLAIGVAFHHFIYSYMYHSGHGWVLRGFDINFFLGRFGVAIFFIISGYLFYNKVSSKTNWKVFFIKGICA